jgi:peroxiredoxin
LGIGDWTLFGYWLLVIGYFTFSIAAGCGPVERWTRLPDSVEAPDFTLEQLDGAPVQLSSLRGQVVVMEFWASWCGPCRMSTPSLDVVYRKFRDRGVAVLLVNLQESPETARRWTAGRFAAPVLLDREGQVAARYGVRALPRLFIIDRQGRIQYARSGYGGGLERSLSQVLEELLAEAAPAADV